MYEGHDPTPLAEAQGIDKTYKVYSYRYFISAFYLAAAIINSLGWVCTSPILTKLVEFYGVDITTVTTGASTIYLIVFIPSSFLSYYILERFGIRIGFLLGSAVTIISLWLKTLAKGQDDFTWIVIGQGLGGFAAPFILNCPQKISAAWYPPEQRTLSTTILSVAAPIGVGLGFVFTPLLVTAEGKLNPEGREQVVHIFNIIAIVGTILIAPALGLFKERPPTPPSKSAESSESAQTNFKESMMNLLKNKNYLIFLFGVSLMWGTYGTLATVLQPLIDPFDYSSKQSGLFGGIVLIMGLIGSPIWGTYVGRTRKFKMTLLLLGACSTTILTLLLLIGPYGNPYFTGIGIGLYGFFTTPMLPIIFELCCELTFPVPESSSGGITYMMTQVVAIIGSTVLSKLLDHKDGEPKNTTGAYIGFAVLITFQCFGFLGFFLTKEDLRRAKFERGETNDDASKEGFTYSNKLE